MGAGAGVRSRVDMWSRLRGRDISEANIFCQCAGHNFLHHLGDPIYYNWYAVTGGLRIRHPDETLAETSAVFHH